MNAMSDLNALLSEWNIPAESAPARGMTAYLTLLEKWNARINLTASTAWNAIGPMFREAIWASRLYPAGSVRHMDVGTGAGFPALLLKVLIPRLQLDLIEVRERKCQFLETAASRLGLENVRVHQMRLEKYLAQCPPEQSWDCVSWKALRMAMADIQAIHTRGPNTTQLWMFHGQEPAVDNAETLLSLFLPVHKHRIPGTRESYLSIFQAR